MLQALSSMFITLHITLSIRHFDRGLYRSSSETEAVFCHPSYIYISILTPFGVRSSVDIRFQSILVLLLSIELYCAWKQGIRSPLLQKKLCKVLSNLISIASFTFASDQVLISESLKVNAAELNIIPSRSINQRPKVWSVEMTNPPSIIPRTSAGEQSLIAKLSDSDVVLIGKLYLCYLQSATFIQFINCSR